MKNRNESLDALRGCSILAMVLSGSISFSASLPAWMYHAQVPPPNHTFMPAIAGITWVDLVFPFFLFSMGAAIPLALNKKAKKDSSFLPVLSIALRRFLLLAFFALFIEHMKAWVIAAQPLLKENLLSIVAFVMLFFQLYENKQAYKKKLFIGLKISSFVIAVALLFSLRFRGETFSFYKSDIIIIVLANMAFFGTIIWWFTKNHAWLRIGILPFIMAVFLVAKEPTEGWVNVLFNFNQLAGFHFDWMYQFYFLKYLFIIIPGTFAGEWLLKYNETTYSKTAPAKKTYSGIICLLTFLLVVSNTALLFGRYLLLNFSLSVLMIIAIYWLLKKYGDDINKPFTYFLKAGAYLLLLGLFFEAYEGGIKKDHSTYSYYFVSSGLAFFMLIVFGTLSQSKIGAGINNYFSLNGRNPMLAYVTGSLLLMPILQLTGLHRIFDSMNSSASLGFLKGVLFTGIVSLITVFCTKRGWFWKT